MLSMPVFQVVVVVSGPLTKAHLAPCSEHCHHPGVSRTTSMSITFPVELPVESSSLPG